MTSIPTTYELALSLIELADLFGVSVCLFAIEQEQVQHTWIDGSFRERSTRTDRRLMITVYDHNRIGQAWTEDWSVSSLQRAFHFARKHTMNNSLLTHALEELAGRELRYPPYTCSEHQLTSCDPGFVREAENQHHILYSDVSRSHLTSIFTMSNERHFVMRSDGHSQQTQLVRALSRHRWVGQNQLQAGTSTLSSSPLSRQLFAASFTEQFQSLPLENSQTKSSQHSTYLIEENVSDKYLLVDVHLLSRLVYAWIQSAAQPISSVATIQAEAIEGSPGFFPFHPLGYLFSPLPVLSPEGTSLAILEALRADHPFSAHLSVKLPMLSDKKTCSLSHISSLLERRGLVDNETYSVLEGASQIHYDTHSGTCYVFPRRVWKPVVGSLSPQEAVPFHFHLDRLLSGIIGGFGATQIAWATDDSLWTVSAPSYVFLCIR